MHPRHLYIHIPFCVRRCSYCDFAIAVRRAVPVEEYLGGVRAELESRVTAGVRPYLDTVYLGGGTPSRLGAEGIGRLLGTAREFFDVSEGAEITIEANPDDVNLASALAWKTAGVNRVSLGVQSFDDSVLAWMHRTHDAAQARAAFQTLRSAGITNLSVDLIFALPDQLHRSWESDVRAAIALGADHISLYGLTVEHSTPLARWLDRGIVSVATEEAYADEFLLADSLAAEAGFNHYEVSNFAMPGRESRHNSAYWSGAHYLGIGPSAHSFDGETRSWNVPQYAPWIARLAARQSVVEGSERLESANLRSESVYLGLRTSQGLAASQDDLKRVKPWKDAGWARIDNSMVRLTPEGWLRLDSLAAGLTGL